jgi:hypothetical protein
VRGIALLLGWVVASALPPPAEARVVYVRVNATAPELGDAGEIVVARNDGSSPKTIAHGSHPVIAPDGHHVAYFTHKAGGGYKLKVVSSQGGRPRVILQDSFPPGPGAPLAWSHSSRYIAAAGAGPTGAVVDARTGTRVRTVDFDFQFDGASFSPDDTDVMFDNGSERGTTLLLAHTHRQGVRTIRTGTLAVWVQAGIFFTNTRIRLLRRPRSAARTVYKGQGSTTLFTVGASADGQTVLAAEGPTDHQLSPVLIASELHAAWTVPTVLSEIDGVSRHGKQVLGVADGSVVVAAADGGTRVIAASAISPSWTG